MAGFARTTEHPFIVLVKDDDRRERGLNAFDHAEPHERASAMEELRTSTGIVGSGFRGEVTSRNLLELVQLVTMSMSSGALRLACAEGRGTMWLEDGMIVHAEAGAQRGERAFQCMLRWTRGTFHIEVGVAAPERSITFSTTELLLEGARLLDEEAGGRTVVETGPLVVSRTPAEHFERGLEAVHEKRYNDALCEWERALHLEPENRVYQHNLRRLRALIESARERTPPGGGQ